MPIKSRKELVCQRCGKTYVVEINDNVTVEELKKLNNKVCMKCKIINAIKCAVKGGGA